MIDGIRGLPPSGILKKDLSKSDEKKHLSSSGEKKYLSGKSYSFHYDSSKDDTFQKSPHFLRTLSMPRTDAAFEESVTAFQESLGHNRQQAGRKSELKLILEKEAEKLREIYHLETQQRAKEVENLLNEYWEGKIEDLHREYKQKMNEYEKKMEQANVANYTGETQREDDDFNLNAIRGKLEKKYYTEYLQKVEEIKRNFEKIDEENKAQIVEDIIKELEPLYGEDLADKIIKLEKDLNQEIEKKKMESTLRSRDLKNTLESSLGKYNLPLGGSHIENKSGVDEAQAIKVYYEGVMTTLRDKYQNEEKILWKELAVAEEKAKSAIQKDMEERLGKEFKRREKLLDVEWRQRMDKYSTSLKKKFETQLKSQIDNEKKNLIEEKNEVGRFKSQTSLKLKKTQNAKQDLEQKLARQEEVYQKEIDELERMLNNLKEKYPNRIRPPTVQKKFDVLERSNIQINGYNSLSGFNHTFNDAQDKENKDQLPVVSSQHDKVYQKIKKAYKPNDENQRRQSLKERRASSLFVEERTLKERSPNENTQTSTQEPRGLYMQSLENKMKKFEGLLRKSGADGIMKSIIDAMKPPELPSVKGKDKKVSVDVISSTEDENKPKNQIKEKERISTRGNETDKSDYILKSDSSIAYNQLKEEILKKYQPKQIGETEISMHASDLKENKEDLIPIKEKLSDQIYRKASQIQFKKERKEDKEKRERSREKSNENKRREEKKIQEKDFYEKEVENDAYMRDYLDKERESIRRSTYQNQRSSVGSRLKWDTSVMESQYEENEANKSISKKSDERYWEIVHKYLDKGKSEREVAAERMKQSSKRVGLKTKYQEIFEIREKDPAQVKSLKKFKKTIEESIELDNGFAAKYLAREIFFLTDFVSNLNTDDIDYKESLRNKFRELYEGWEITETSFQARLNFLQDIEMTFNLEEIYQKVDVEVDYLARYAEDIHRIIACLKKRNKLRTKIDEERFEYKTHKKLYVHLDDVIHNMKTLLQEYHRSRKKEIVFKGIDLSDIIKLDCWEHEFLKEKEHKELLWEAVKNRY